MRSLSFCLALVLGLSFVNQSEAQGPVRDFLKSRLCCANTCQPVRTCKTVCVPVTRTRTVRTCGPCGVQRCQQTYTACKRVRVQSECVSTCNTTCNSAPYVVQAPVYVAPAPYVVQAPVCCNGGAVPSSTALSDSSATLNTPTPTTSVDVAESTILESPASTEVLQGTAVPTFEVTPVADESVELSTDEPAVELSTDEPAVELSTDEPAVELSTDELTDAPSDQ